jgi:hypothetical protein
MAEIDLELATLRVPLRMDHGSLTHIILLSELQILSLGWNNFYAIERLDKVWQTKKNDRQQRRACHRC